MTVFTAVSIALSTSGSTFAALNQFSNLFDDRIKDLRQEAKSAHTFISENVLTASAESRVSAESRIAGVRRWYGGWKYCSILPVAALLIFSSWVGLKVAWRISGQGSEDLQTSEHTFYAVWIWIILSVNALSLATKGWSWRRISVNKTELAKCRCHIEDAKSPNSGASTNVQPGPYPQNRPIVLFGRPQSSKSAPPPAQ
jgi:hypothetical protein